MNIAILGWGSLIWDTRELQILGDWICGGPKLPIEFSRLSNDGRLTLVIDPENGVEALTRYSRSSAVTLDEAVVNLMKREGTIEKYIGYTDISNNTNSSTRFPSQIAVHNLIAEWARANSFDIVLWTALPSNFREKTQCKYSSKNAWLFLKDLEPGVFAIASQYIENAPEEVVTPFRLYFNQKIKS